MRQHLSMCNPYPPTSDDHQCNQGSRIENNAELGVAAVFQVVLRIVTGVPTIIR